MNVPTKTQAETLDAWAALIRENGHGPTLAELGERLGIGKVAAFERVRMLIRDGFARRIPGRQYRINPYQIVANAEGACPVCGK